MPFWMNWQTTRRIFQKRVGTEYGARVGKFDDLVSALGLAIFYAENEGVTLGPMIW